MRKAVYILLSLLCIQFTVVCQTTSVKELLGQALEVMSENPNRAVKLTNQAFKKASKLQDMYGMITSKSVMGDISMEVEDYEAAYVNFSDALEFLEESDTTDLYNKTVILNNLAIIKSIFGDHRGSSDLYALAYQTASQYIQEYRQMAEKYGDITLLIDLPYDQAVELKKDGQYLAAGEILIDLWEKSEFRRDTILLAQVVNELGLIRLENGEFSKAQEFFAIAAFNDGVDPELRAKTMHNLAVAYMEQEDYSKANKYYADALELKKVYGEPYSQFLTMLDQGELAFVQNDVEAAIGKWEMALQTYDKIENFPELFIVHDWLQKAYLSTDLQKAALNGDLYSSYIKDWMNIQSSQKNSTPTLQAFNTKIDAILAGRQLKAERLALLKRYWPLGVVGILLIMLFVYMVQLSFNRRREQVLEQNLRTDRAVRADEIMSRIRRD